jgi:hypothetical protein
MLVIYLIFNTALAQITKEECPFMECARLDDGVCAQIFAEGIYINEKGCPRDLTCSAEEIFKKHRETVFDEPPWYVYLDCEENTKPALTNIPNTLVECPIRNITDNLESGSHPKLCESDSECITKNNKTPKCKCGIYGFKYCEALMSSDVFEDFWKRCEKDSTLTLKEWKVWEYLVENFVYLISAPSCGEEVLEEMNVSFDYILDGDIYTLLPYLLLTGVLFI